MQCVSNTTVSTIIPIINPERRYLILNFILFCKAQASYQVKVPTELAGKFTTAFFPLNSILNCSALAASFKTNNTFLPSGVLNAALGKLFKGIVLGITTDPAGTNFD